MGVLTVAAAAALLPAIAVLAVSGAVRLVSRRRMQARMEVLHLLHPAPAGWSWALQSAGGTVLHLALVEDTTGLSLDCLSRTARTELEDLPAARAILSDFRHTGAMTHLPRPVRRAAWQIDILEWSPSFGTAEVCIEGQPHSLRLLNGTSLDHDEADRQLGQLLIDRVLRTRYRQLAEAQHLVPALGVQA